jgi:DDE superfamily endonuclease
MRYGAGTTLATRRSTAMPTSSLATFALVLSSFRRHFTAPTFVRFLVLVAGWILAGEPARCVTEALVASGVSGVLHWQAFHRFFSRARWQIDALGRTLLGLLGPLLSSGRLELVLDDTLCAKSGRSVFGAAMHVDPVSSTKRRKNLVRGHCWVVLAVVVDVPWSKRPWAIPLLFRLYRGKKEAGAADRTKSALGREMVDLVLGWLPPTGRVHLLLDSGYMTRTMLHGLPLERVTVFGALKTNAALWRAPGAPRGERCGRRPKRGERLATPKAMHGDRRWRWATVTASVYGRAREQRVLSLQALWYGVLGERLTRVAVVDVDPRRCSSKRLAAGRSKSGIATASSILASPTRPPGARRPYAAPPRGRGCSAACWSCGSIGSTKRSRCPCPSAPGTSGRKT